MEKEIVEMTYKLNQYQENLKVTEESLTREQQAVESLRDQLDRAKVFIVVVVFVFLSNVAILKRSTG